MRESVPTNVKPFPAPAPGYQLVPAAIGRGDGSQIVYLQCPTWCVIDHVATPEASVEDVHHYGERQSLMFPVPSGPGAPLTVFLAQWPASYDEDAGQPYLAVDTDCEVTSYQRPAALALADQLVAFAADVRRMAQTLPDGTPAPVLSQADEFLRRARGGAA